MVKVVGGADGGNTSKTMVQKRSDAKTNADEGHVVDQAQSETDT